jgi:hypothetical protein
MEKRNESQFVFSAFTPYVKNVHNECSVLNNNKKSEIYFQGTLNIYSNHLNCETSILCHNSHFYLHPSEDKAHFKF